MTMRPNLHEINLHERPLLVFWEVTRACALACKHCRATAQPHAHPDELNHDEAMEVIDQLAELRPAMLVLTGGDPVMRMDIFDIIRRASDKGLHVALSPAATARLLHTDFGQLKEAGVKSMSLSLDGATAETHDAFRGVPHTFERTIEAARRATEVGIHLQINTTITRRTIAEFDQFVDLMKDLHPAMWSIFLLVPTGRAIADEMPTAEQVEEVWHRLAEVSQTVPFGVKTTEGHHYRRVALQDAKGQGSKPARKAVPTRDGKGVMFISHTGDIQPSGFLPMTAGNVRTSNLKTIYQEHPLFKLLRDDNALTGKCGRCEYRTICGGSRSRAYAVSGDPMAEDTLCCYQPKRAENHD
jgi:radical SAM protein with 4Fe4S-binding SPASM domain